MSECYKPPFGTSPPARYAKFLSLFFSSHLYSAIEKKKIELAGFCHRPPKSPADRLVTGDKKPTVPLYWR
jgi:hypothetical protein